jgi:hypothetical protein
MIFYVWMTAIPFLCYRGLSNKYWTGIDIRWTSIDIHLVGIDTDWQSWEQLLLKYLAHRYGLELNKKMQSNHDFLSLNNCDTFFWVIEHFPKNIEQPSTYIGWASTQSATQCTSHYRPSWLSIPALQSLHVLGFPASKRSRIWVYRWTSAIFTRISSNFSSLICNCRARIHLNPVKVGPEEPSMTSGWMRRESSGPSCRWSVMTTH